MAKECSNTSCNKSSCEGCGQKQPQSLMAEPNVFSDVKHVIGVVSGKGGVLYSIAISASGLKNRKKQKGKEFEMRIVDNFGRRYKWSKTEITCSLETMELVFQDKVEKRTLYIDEYKNGSKVEYVGP